MKKLGEIAKIRTGYPFRGRIEHAEEGNCWLVQMGNVQANAVDAVEAQARVHLAEGPGRHALRAGDVLFVGRGSRNDAARFVSEGGDTIAAPHLFVLSPRTEAICPEFLVWFLNVPETREKIRALRRGSALPFVPLGALAALEMPLPTVEQQRVIGELYGLGLREQELLREIGVERQRLLDGTLLQFAKRSD